LPDIDRFYTWAIVEPVIRASSLANRIDGRWIDKLLHLAAYVPVTLAHLTQWFDRNMINGVVNNTGKAALGVGAMARSIINGKIQSYILWAMTGLFGFIIWLLLN